MLWRGYLAAFIQFARWQALFRAQLRYQGAVTSFAWLGDGKGRRIGCFVSRASNSGDLSWCRAGEAVQEESAGDAVLMCPLIHLVKQTKTDVDNAPYRAALCLPGVSPWRAAQWGKKSFNNGQSSPSLGDNTADSFWVSRIKDPAAL